MNILKKIVAGLLILTPAIAMSQIAPAGDNSYSGYLVNQPAGVAYSQSYTLDLAKYDASKVSAQVIFSTVIFTSPTFSDGSESTGSVKVIGNGLGGTGGVVGLSSASATDQVTIISTTGLTGACLTVANSVLCYGPQWAKGATVTATAVNLAAAISRLPNLAASNVAGVVYATATYGSYANSWKFVSNNTSVTVNTANMVGGADNAVLKIGGVALTQGVQWQAGASTTTAVLSLGNAIAGAGLSLSTAAQAGGIGVIVATSTLNGTAYNYTLVSSTPTALSVWQPVMVGGLNPGDTLGSGILTAGSATGLVNALPVLWTIGSNPAIGGLTTGTTTYYAYPVSATQFELVKYASSAFAGAPASDFVVVTGTNSQVGAHTYTIAPLAFSAGFSTFTWQSSDDNADWVTSAYTGNVSTAAIVITTLSTAQDLPIDFGVFNYRYLRLNFQAPSSGAVNLVVPVNIKQDGIGKF